MIYKSINIFDIFSTADEELVHSSIMKFFLENFTEQTLEFLEFKDSKKH